MANQLDQPNLNVANFQEYLTAHDHLKRSMDLPLFHGDETKDITTRQLLIDRIEAAAKIATWDASCQVQELSSILRGPA